MSKLKIEAVVKMNGGYAFVFNRLPVYKYQRDGDLLWAKDGPFYSCYRYEAPSGRFKAFAGREFDLDLLDGGVEHCSGQWWDGGIGVIQKKLKLNLGDLSMQIKERLIDCYVFFGTSCDLDELEKLKSKYTGAIYEYYDYEKVIKYHPNSSKAYDRQVYAKRANKHLVKKVKELSLRVKQLEKAET